MIRRRTEVRNHPDVVVVGAGIVGAAIARELTERGAAVGVADQARTVAAGATGLSGGMVRAYDPDPAVGELAGMSLRRYAEERSSSTGRPVLHRVGAVTIADRGARQRLETAAARLGDETFVTTADEVLGIHLAGGAALVEPNAGWVDPALLTRDWLDGARAGGATALLGRRALRVDQDGGRPRVELDGGTVLRAGVVIVAVGAWTVRPPAGLRRPSDVRTRSIQVSVLARGRADRAHATFVDLRTGAYGRPIDAASSLVGLPHEVWDVDPGVAARPSMRHAARTAEAASKHLPWAASAPTLRLVRAVDGFSSEPGLLRRTGTSRVWRVRAWNGSGVRVAPAAALTIADSVLEELDS
jgi:glycine/D-amino acid oxidase-like deaminating enzyme